MQGCDGVVKASLSDVEIFREEYWRQPIDVISREAKGYWEKLTEKLG